MNDIHIKSCWTLRAPTLVVWLLLAAPQARSQAPPSFAPPNFPQDAPAAAGPPTRVAMLRPIESAKKVAEVGSQVVLASELIWHVNQLMAASADRIPPNTPPEMLDQLREHATKSRLNSILITKLVINDLYSSGIPREGIANVEKRLLEPFEETVIPEYIAEYGVRSRAELEARLRDEGGSIALLRQSYLETRLAQVWLSEQTADDSTITRDELEREYESRLAEFEFPAKARWQELMVRLDRFGGDRAAAFEAIAKMGNLVWAHENGRGGAPFEIVAKQESHGFTAAEGGVHDWTAQGSLVAEKIDEAIFSLPIGQRSKIIPSEQGFHIIRVLERTAAGRTPFEEAQGQIREQLLAERRNNKQREYLEKLRKDVRIWTVYTGPTTAEEFSKILPQ